MKKGSCLIPATVAGGLALVLGGCGGGTGTASVSDGDGGVVAKTATVNLAVAFPEANAGKALISSDAQAVGFRYCRIPQGSHWCDAEMDGVEVAVTRDNPTASVSLSPGLYQFEAATFASALMDTPIDFASTAGEIVEGANQVVMSFLGGDWTFKSSTGADETLTLGDGTVISGFKLYPDTYSNTTPAAAAASVRKATFDTTIPVAGWMGYGAVLKASSGDLDAGWLEVISQFHSGSDNNTTLAGLALNLTQNCPGWDCEPVTGDWSADLIGVHYDDYEDYYSSLFPSETLTDSSGNPVDTSGLDTAPTDGVTIVGDIADYQFGGKSVSLVDATATAAKAVAGDAPRSRAAALAALASASGAETATKSVTTTDMGTLVSTWYEEVIVASGTGTDRGTWNFDDYVYNPTTDSWDLVEDGCLVTGGTTVYATCGWLDSVWDTTTSTYVSDPGEFAWAFAPTDPADLGEYCYQGWYDDASGAWVCDNDSVVGGYDPWYFQDMNGDGTIDYGSFQFSYYLKTDETLNNVRIHRFTAKGVELPATDVVLQ